jgi:hypothetical protein
MTETILDFSGLDEVIREQSNDPVARNGEMVGSVSVDVAKLAYDAYSSTLAAGGTLAQARANFAKHNSGIPSPDSFGAKELLKKSGIIS